MNTVTLNRISPDEALELLKETNGRVFRASFIRVDGSLREGVFRLGVTRHLRGGTKKYDAAAKRLLTVFDMAKQGYRSIALDRLISVTVNGERFEIS